MIGPSWTTVTGADGTPRLAQPDDLLRREIERALERRDVDVIPVLVQRARMPAPHDLPPSVRALARRQAIELSDARWSHDMGQLIAHLSEVLEGTSAVRPARPPQPQPQPQPGEPRERERVPASGDEPKTTNERLIAAGAMLAAAVLGVLVASLFTEGLAERRAFGAPELDRIVYYSAERAVIWAIVGALVLAAAAATLRRDRASALGWAVLGLGFGAVAGALGGAAYMALKDQALLNSEHLLRGVAAGVVGIVLASALAKARVGRALDLPVRGPRRRRARRDPRPGRLPRARRVALAEHGPVRGRRHDRGARGRRDDRAGRPRGARARAVAHLSGSPATSPPAGWRRPRPTL